MKLKPDYLTGGSETFDCVIIGGNYGKGKRSGLITQYIVAVIDDIPKGGKPTVWVSAPESLGIS
jgi:ATP-dependent DNA ligase